MTNEPPHAVNVVTWFDERRGVVHRGDEVGRAPNGVPIPICPAGMTRAAKKTTRYVTTRRPVDCKLCLDALVGIGRYGNVPEAPPEILAQIEAWIKRRRDQHLDAAGLPTNAWGTLNDLLDNFRDHVVTGTPLDREVARPHGEEA